MENPHYHFTKAGLDPFCPHCAYEAGASAMLEALKAHNAVRIRDFYNWFAHGMGPRVQHKKWGQCTLIAIPDETTLSLLTYSHDAPSPESRKGGGQSDEKEDTPKE